MNLGRSVQPTAALAAATTALFVPGDQPARYAKALASGADAVVIDLEDAVAPGKKNEARTALVAYLSDLWLRQPHILLRIAVRINPLATAGTLDITALNTLDERIRHAIAGVLVPKSETAEELDQVDMLLGRSTALTALVESAEGIEAVGAIARARGVQRLAFGALDFTADVGSSDTTLLDHARSRLVIASAAARIAPPLDSPNPEFRDASSVDSGARRARALGFGGQLCIHPLQVDIVGAAFTPSDEEVSWARNVIDAAENGAVTRLDGVMIDLPVVLRAQALLRRNDDAVRRDTPVRPQE